MVITITLSDAPNGCACGCGSRLHLDVQAHRADEEPDPDPDPEPSEAGEAAELMLDALLKHYDIRREEPLASISHPTVN